MHDRFLFALLRFIFYTPKRSICCEGRRNFRTKYALTQGNNIHWQVYILSSLLFHIAICNVRGITKMITDLIHHSLYRRMLRCPCGQLGYIRQKQPVILWRTLQSPIQRHSELFRQYTGLFERRLLVVTPPVFPEHLKLEARRFHTRTSLPLRPTFPSSRTTGHISTVLRPNRETWLTKTWELVNRFTVKKKHSEWVRRAVRIWE